MDSVKDVTPGRGSGSAKTDNDAPSREEAEKAVETLIRWAGDNPSREGLRETPQRVIRAYGEFFAGYALEPKDVLGKTFEEYGEYNDFVLVRNIDFVSHCEHHMVPIIGKAHVAYWPQNRVVGISKLARIVDAYAKRLTMQEKMNRQIVGAIESVLKPRGCAVLIDAVHHCMSARGVMKPNSSTITSVYSGIFESDEAVRRRFLDMIKS